MSLQRIQSFSFLKSSRFLFQFLGIPKIIGAEGVGYFSSDIVGGIIDNSLSSKTYDSLLRDMTFICDSIEFPGQTLTTSDHRIPGTLKIKTPTVREYSEINATFLYPAEFPLYEFFNEWMWSASAKNTQNNYFDDIVGQARIIQFLEGGEGATGGAGATELNSATIEGQTPFNAVSIKNIYPLSFAPMPSNWADDGFHKMSVTFFFEGMEIVPFGQNVSTKKGIAANARLKAQLEQNIRRARNILTLERASDISNFNDLS